MFNNHSITVVTDLNLLQGDISSLTIATITQFPMNNMPPNVYYAGLLYPPTELMMRWADSVRYDVMSIEYPRFLMNKDQDDMIVALLAALTKSNVIIYIPPEEFSIFGGIFLNHLYYVYGVVCNTPNSTFYIVPDKIPFLVIKFYLMNLMDPDEFLKLFPSNYPLPDEVVFKLSNDLMLFDGTLEQYRVYFDKIRQRNNEKKVLFEVVR